MTKGERDPHFAIRLDAEDRALLEAVAKKEKLTKSDVLRRGLRKYAEVLGVRQPRVPKN